MEELHGDQLVELASLIVTLMIFFSIDAKYRFKRGRSPARGLFRVTSMVGGVSTAIALTVVWVEMFLPDENKAIHMLVYFVPASIAVIAALILAIEVIFLRKDEQENT